MKAQYIIIEHSMTYPDEAVEFKSDWTSSDPSLMAADAAELHHTEGDGWDDEWPLTFEIFVIGISLGRYTVERESCPVFTANRLEDQ